MNVTKLKPEGELEYKEDRDPNTQNRKIVHKYGFTQGSPLSPILCNYALELGGLGEEPGLTMYADDGLIISDQDPNVRELLGTLRAKLVGVNLATDKPYGEAMAFKFLGLNYDLDRRLV